MMVSLRVDVAFAVATYSCLTLAVMGEEWGSVLEKFATSHHRPIASKVQQPPSLEPFPSKCANAHWTDKLAVAARYHEDVSWMAESLVPWLPFLVYSTMGGGNATHKTVSNTGREAQAYLQFIVEYYDCLPQEIVFIHAHHTSEHSPDILTDLKRLKWGSIPGHVGLSRPQYVNLFFFHNPDKHYPGPEIDQETAHWMHFARKEALNILYAWPDVFEAELGPAPEEIATPCCGQFVTTKDNILRRSRHFYEGCLRWLQQTDHDYFWAGLVFEHMWAYIIGGQQKYVHPEECEVFTCDSDGNPYMPAWESLGVPSASC